MPCRVKGRPPLLEKPVRQMKNLLVRLPFQGAFG